MSIFRKLKISVGDTVIATKDANGTRAFQLPSMVLEIKESNALIYIEQIGPKWYDMNMLERVYVREEYNK